MLRVLSALVALPDDLSSIPSTHTGDSPTGDRHTHKQTQKVKIKS